MSVQEIYERLICVRDRLRLAEQEDGNRHYDDVMVDVFGGLGWVGSGYSDRSCWDAARCYADFVVSMEAAAECYLERQLDLAGLAADERRAA